MLYTALALVSAFTAPLTPVHSKMGMTKVVMHGGKGFGGGEATRDPEPTVYDPNDPKGKQQAIHKAESFAEYLAKRAAGGGAPAAAAPAAAPAAPAYTPPAAAAAPAAGGGGGGGSISGMLATIEGPDLYWEEKGPLQNPPLEESDFKEFDTFSTFLAACSQFGVDLDQPGITVFAPANKACDEFTSVYGPLTADVCKYHVVKGEVSMAALSSADLTTLQGSTITYRRMFRKDFVDNAFSAMASPPRTSYKSDIKASNGVVHFINECIYPGWSESAGGYGSQ